MVAPPSLAGAVKLTTAWVVPPTATTPVGAPGTVNAGVTAAEALEATLEPTELVAVTVKV